MARSRRSLQDDIKPLIDRFVVQLGKILERHVASDMRRRVSDGVHGRPSTPSDRLRSTGRATITCYFPGCTNTAAPRFGMFCAAEHKSLPAAVKAKYRAQHLSQVK
jgi:hypothetical protein